uniref:CIA30 domain-containing protein n=1 Tax=Heterorhabditis bacteriophora TaxID=37862 RepID=A0A1I7WRW6_HETBA
MGAGGEMPLLPAAAPMPLAGEADGFQESARVVIRSDFPETWLWTNITVDESVRDIGPFHGGYGGRGQLVKCRIIPYRGIEDQKPIAFRLTCFIGFAIMAEGSFPVIFRKFLRGGARPMAPGAVPIMAADFGGISPDSVPVSAAPAVKLRMEFPESWIVASFEIGDIRHDEKTGESKASLSQDNG